MGGTDSITATAAAASTQCTDRATSGCFHFVVDCVTDAAAGLIATPTKACLLKTKDAEE
jgi:hypothetical protein